MELYIKLEVMEYLLLLPIVSQITSIGLYLKKRVNSALAFSIGALTLTLIVLGVLYRTNAF